MTSGMAIRFIRTLLSMYHSFKRQSPKSKKTWQNKRLKPKRLTNLRIKRGVLKIKSPPKWRVVKIQTATAESEFA